MVQEECSWRGGQNSRASSRFSPGYSKLERRAKAGCSLLTSATLDLVEQLAEGLVGILGVVTTSESFDAPLHFDSQAVYLFGHRLIMLVQQDVVDMLLVY